MSINDPQAKTRKVRRRRTPEEAKSEALVSARQLLLDHGPDGVTLKAVAQEIGMTHANLIHHFGSAAALQSALMAGMVADLSEALEDAIAHLKSDESAPRVLIDKVFDAFDQGGAGHLAAWIALSHDLGHLDQVREVVNQFVKAIEDKFAAEGDSSDVHDRVTSAFLFIALSALGDAIAGERLRDMLGREPDAMRKVVARVLPSFFLP